MGRGRILLAHGNLDCQTIYSSVLVHSGYAVQIVDTVDEALERLAGGGYDAVLSDLHLDSAGDSDDCLVRRLRLSPFGAHLPALVLTAWTMEGDRQLAHDIGADRFLAMPVTPQQVVAAVEELLEQHGDTPKLPMSSPHWDLRRLTVEG
jgi:CheY-like chemotaxis protein